MRRGLTTSELYLPGNPGSEEIRPQLHRIAQSSVFRPSLRLTCFLTFVVETTLAGKGETLKAYTIAVEALRRHDDFDPQTNPIVRVEAGRLRQALTRYYAGEGCDDPIVIEVPRGTYTPIFVRRTDAPGQGVVGDQRHASRNVSASATEIVRHSEQIAGSLAHLQELAKVHRLQIAAVAGEIANARQTLRDMRRLLPRASALLPSRAAKAPAFPPSSIALNAAEDRPERPLQSNIAFRMLDAIEAQLRASRDLHVVVETILNGLVLLHRSDLANIQLLDERAGELIMVAQRGFHAALLRPVMRISTTSDGYVSGRAARTRAPVILDDVFADAEYSGLCNLAAQAGYQAVQSTPMITSDGRLVGVISTHFASPHATARLDMLMTQFYARLAANVLAQLLPPAAIADRPECAA